MNKQIVQVGMCSILNWPNDYNWGETEKHKTHGGHWEFCSGIGGVGDELAMRMFFKPYTQYRAIKEKYPHLYFKHYSVVHPRSYDPNPLFNGGSVLSLYENNPYIDEIQPIYNHDITEKDYYKAGLNQYFNIDEQFQWLLKCLDKYLAEIAEENNEIPLIDIVEKEEFEEDEPHLYVGEENKQFAQSVLEGLSRPLIGLQVNKSANHIVEAIPLFCQGVQDIIPGATVVCVGTTDVPQRWLNGIDNVVSFSGKTTLLEGISLIDNFDLFFCMFSGLMYAAFIQNTPTIIWADEEKGENCLGLVSWYSKNLNIDMNRNHFLVADQLSIDDILEEVCIMKKEIL
jgi:hypothetical protein